MTNCKDCKEARKKQKLEYDLALKSAKKKAKVFLVLFLVTMFLLFCTNAFWACRVI